MKKEKKTTHQRLNVKHAGKVTKISKDIVEKSTHNKVSILTSAKQPKEVVFSPWDCFAQRINLNFAEWLSGFTDGDGCFSFSPSDKKRQKWGCTYKLDASLSNFRLLYVLRSALGYGKISLKSGNKSGSLRIWDRKTLNFILIPLFKNYPLYTAKAFYFSRWCRALETLENPGINTIKKARLLEQLSQQKVPPDYIAPAWSTGAPSINWVAGFIESKGSFFITNKGGSKKERFVHAFGVTQRLDLHCLEHIRRFFHIPAKVLKSKHGFYKLETTNSRSLRRIENFFLNKFRARKSLEFRIWSRTLKWQGNNERLKNVQQQLRRVRNGIK